MSHKKTRAMTLKQKIGFIARGYADAKDGTPYKRAPEYPNEALLLPPGYAPEEVTLYWEGWNSGIKNSVRRF